MANNPQMPGEHTFGQAGVLYLLATADEPMTVKEIAAVSPLKEMSADGTIRQLYRKGLLARRKRQVGQGGQKPYEYALRAKQDVPYINDD